MKSGTTSLYHILKDHPDVYFPYIKEPHFFVQPGQPFKYFGKGDQEIADMIFVSNEDQYFNLYKGADNKIVGDASAMYLYYSNVPKNIMQFVQEPYIVMVLRNPVDRAYSSYLHLSRDYREVLSFEKGLELEEKRIIEGYNPIWHYKKAGLYSGQVSNYLSTFSKVKIILYEDLKKSSSDVLVELCQFLNISEDIRLDNEQRFNVSGVPKSKFLHQLLRRPHPLKGVLKPLMPRKIREQIKNSVTNRNLEKAKPMDELTRKYLQAYFSEDISKLEDLINRDLSVWKNV